MAFRVSIFFYSEKAFGRWLLLRAPLPNLYEVQNADFLPFLLSNI